tara:strand:+ start:13842 stop:14015 length:174 start_codon:yes stop_codon:yes gene_type:complete
MENFEKLKELLSNLTEDAEKFYDKKNNAAGTRLRQGMQQLKKIAQDVRVEVSELKKK